MSPPRAADLASVPSRRDNDQTDADEYHRQLNATSVSKQGRTLCSSLFIVTIPLSCIVSEIYCDLFAENRDLSCI